MRVTLRYFAGLREAVGLDREVCDLPDDVDTTTRLRAWLRARGGAWATSLAEGRPVRAAVDQVMVGSDDRIAEGAEVAFFPPVTGG